MACGSLLVCSLTAHTNDAKIPELLDLAETREREGHLIYPARGSAMSIYHDILYLEPANEHALNGLVRLAEHHLEAAQTAIELGQLIKADSLVSKARMIYPEYPAVETVQRQITLLENAERSRTTLNWRQVADRSPALTTQLQQLGHKAKAGDCRVTINVSSDAEGRWIYKHMNRASGDGRVRAEVRIASPAAVDILCFQAVDADSD